MGDAAALRQTVSVNDAVCPLLRLRAGRLSDGPVVDCSSSGPPVAAAASALQLKVKPPETLLLASCALTTPANRIASEALADAPPEKLGVMVTRSVHGEHVTPSPAMPTGHASHAVALAHATPL